MRPHTQFAIFVVCVVLVGDTYIALLYGELVRFIFIFCLCGAAFVYLYPPQRR